MSERPQAPISTAASAPIGLSIEARPKRETVEIIPSGELDLASVEQLQRELERQIDVGFARIIIDLRRVEFLDSTALHLILSAHARAEREAWQLAIIPGPRAVQRIFEITHTIDRLPFTAVNGRASASQITGPGSPPPAR